MRLRTFILIISIILLADCHRSHVIEHNNIQDLLETLGKEKNIEFNKFPPRLVKAFLKFDKSNNQGLQELLGMSQMFIVVHVPKNIEDSKYDEVKYNIENHIKNNLYKEIMKLKFEKIMFKEFFSSTNGDLNNIVLEIDESNLYTIYYLKGNFSHDDIIRVSKKVSPVEFLKLNRKIRKK